MFLKADVQEAVESFKITEPERTFYMFSGGKPQEFVFKGGYEYTREGDDIWVWIRIIKERGVHDVRMLMSELWENMERKIQ